MKTIASVITILLSFFVSQGQNNNLTTMDSEWNKYKLFLKSELPIYFERFNDGADIASLNELQNYLDIILPEEFKAIYLENNGEDTSWFVGGVLFGMKMLTIEEIKKEWLQLNDLENEFKFNSKWSGSIYPAQTIKQEDYNTKWIPLFSDKNGNYIGVDLAPDVKGRVGQIINFGTDEHSHYVFANSLNDFIALINQKIEDGTALKAIFQDGNGQNILFGLHKESHLIDDLKELLKTN